MTNNSMAQTIRAKKLGVLIREARLSAGKEIADCAQVLGTSVDVFEQYELATKSPSLPELELLTTYLNLPADHFWQIKKAVAENASKNKRSPQQVIPLRQRIIGVTLRKVRSEANVSLEALAEKTAIPAQVIETYEFGGTPIPMPELENLSKALGTSVEVFQEKSPARSSWIEQNPKARGFLALSGDLQDFISQPGNRPYLEIARRLSELPAENLRSIAESILAITY